ncbi:MAG: von Willebrand factor [Verrucomicrobiaceae bacterium]|nr:von Willebrand factor [Verrucomicrobiaceae bacterium]
MKIILRLFPVIALLLPLLIGAQAHAVTPPAATATTHPDVRVLIDISGSMKQNDPNNLRKPALELLVHLFPKDAKAGVWLFGESVDVLVPDQKITEAWRTDARKKAAQISSSSLYTNIPAALDRASAGVDKDYRTSIILLTDGMVDISKSAAENAAARQKLLTEILPRLRQANVIVHTVALSKFADRELMERLAADTGGLFAVAENADALNRIFVQALDASAPAEQVPLAGNHFLVDSSIDELTALVFHKEGKPVELISPDKKTHSFASHGDDIKWFQGTGFDLITVKKPFEGEWTAAAEMEKGSRITIVSNLSLAATRFSESLFSSDPASDLVAGLKQQGEIVVQPEFLKLVKFTATVQRREDNKQWQFDLSAANATPADGYFHNPMAMLNEPGTYDLAIDADGKTFQRSQKQTVAVRENFDVRVVATDAIPPVHRVTLFAQNPEVDAASAKVTAHIKTADGKTSEQTVAASADREWQLTLENAAKDGRIELYFDVAGNYAESSKAHKGEKFTYHTGVIAIDADGSKVIAPPQHEEPAKAPEAEKQEAAKPEEAKPKEEPAKTEEKAEEKAAEPAAEAPKKDWKKWALYGGLAIGNLLILGLGYFAYRMIMGGNKSRVLEEADDEDGEKEETGKKGDSKGKAGAEKSEKGAEKKEEVKEKRVRKQVLDLPDDAIDIDGGDDKKK